MENTNTASTGGSGNIGENKQILPNSTAVLVLGIISIVGVLCSQGILGIVLGIIGLVLSGTPMRMYRENSEAYTEASIKNLKAGRICSIIGVSLGGAILLLVILVITLFGLAGGFFALFPFLQDLPFPDMINLLPF